MIKFYKNLNWLFPAMLAVVLVQNGHDLSIIMSEESLSLYRHDGPIIFKALKDIIYALIFIGILKLSLKVKKSQLSDYSVTLFLLITFLVILSMLDNGIVIGLIGLRWIFPLVLFLLMRGWSQMLDMDAAVVWILIGLTGCLSVQFYQLLYMPPVFGEIFPGIPARTPGFFIAPNSTAFFACVSAACVMVFTPEKLKLNLLAVGLALMVSILAQSGTGMVGAVLLGLRHICRRHKYTFWIITFFTLALALTNLDFLTMRENYIELSGGGRVEAFLNIARDSFFSIDRFGLTTNTANLYSQNPEDQLAPDSLVASWVGNFGFFAPVAALLVVMFIRYRMRLVDWSRAMPCVLVFGIFSMTTIVFEAFPMNIYLALGIWSARRTIR